MFDFIKKGIEFNKLAQSFNAMYMMVRDIEARLERNKNNLSVFREEVKEEVYILAYIAHKGIVTRLDKYNWGFEALIIIPSISSSRVTIGNAWSKTVTKMTIIAGILNLGEDIEEINNEGKLYRTLEDIIPPRLKNW
jgi:hypothetical protein